MPHGEIEGLLEPCHLVAGQLLGGEVHSLSPDLTLDPRVHGRHRDVIDHRPVLLSARSTFFTHYPGNQEQLLSESVSIIKTDNSFAIGFGYFIAGSIAVSAKTTRHCTVPESLEK